MTKTVITIQKINFLNMTNCFNGIIRYLTQKCHGNVDEKNVVKVTSSTVYNDRYPKYVVDLDDDKHYFTYDGQQNSWIKFDFKDKKVRPTHYTLRTKSDSGKGGNHLKNLVVEDQTLAGETNGKFWI